MLFRSGYKVNAADFRQGNLENHLSLNIRVVDDKGKLVASGRDLNLLVAQLSDLVVDRINDRQRHEIEQNGLVSWSFEDLPEFVELKEGGVTVTMYPALIDELDSVAISLVEHRQKAIRLSAMGLLRLILFRLKDQRKYLSKNIPGFENFSLFYATRGNRAELTEHIVKAAFCYTFIDNLPLVQIGRASCRERV